MYDGIIHLGCLVGAAVGCLLFVYYDTNKQEITKPTRNIRRPPQRDQRLKESTSICSICKKAIFGNNSTIRFPSCSHRFHEYCAKFVCAVDTCIVCLYHKKSQKLTTYNPAEQRLNNCSIQGVPKPLKLPTYKPAEQKLNNYSIQGVPKPLKLPTYKPAEQILNNGSIQGVPKPQKLTTYKPAEEILNGCSIQGVAKPQKLTTYKPAEQILNGCSIQRVPNSTTIQSNQANRLAEAGSSRQKIEENRRHLDVMYCIICNDILRDHYSETSFPCKHAFHKNCLTSVFKQNESVKCIICFEGPIKEIHRRDHVDLGNTRKLCPICNSLVQDRAKIFRCGHIFHNKCMRFIFGAHCVWKCITCPQPVSNEYQRTNVGVASIDEDERDICVICMDVLSKTRRRKLTCGYSFHNNCIEKWSAKSKVCPFRCNAKN